MDPLTAAAHWVGDKVMGQLFDQMAKRVLGEFNPQLQQLQRDLQQIRDAHEDLLVAPLREAVRFRELGDLAKAKERLIEAEIKNPLAPMPCLLLADAFRGEGRNDLANEYIARAVVLNPYSAAQFIGSDALVTDGASGALEASDPWVVYLGDRDFVRDLGSRFHWPGRFVQQLLTIGLPSRSTAAIRRASLSGGHVAVDWLLADSLHHKPEHVLSLLEVGTGHTVWARLTTKEELQFATYRHVVVTDGETVSLLDAATGQPVERSPRMSRHYFEIMFGTPATTPIFDKANWIGTPPASAYEKSADYFGEYRGTPGDPGTHRASTYDEEANLMDAFRPGARAIRVRNRWEHFHFTPGPNMFPSCRLIGGAELQSA